MKACSLIVPSQEFIKVGFFLSEFTIRLYQFFKPELLESESEAVIPAFSMGAIRERPTKDGRS